MDSMESKKDATNPPPHPGTEPTITMQNPSNGALDVHRMKLKPEEIEEALSSARKKLIEEDFVQAFSMIDALLEKDPEIDAAKDLREQIKQAAARVSHEIFNQGVNGYMDCDWDRAIGYWKKVLQINPSDSAASEWIAKAERRREQEKLMRADLLQELEECGKMLSERNYVVAEEQLEQLKNKFTGRFRLADLQRIYEALVVRTRVELEKEFEDLRSNIIEPVEPKITEMKRVAGRAELKEAQLKKQYMEAFEAGKKYFESGDWRNALRMWQTARRINPLDENLTHWIALAENHMLQGGPIRKTSPIRATIAFFSVFTLTAVIIYLGYQKYVDYLNEAKNRSLIQRAIEHYRAGRLEESWKTMQIYVLQDPDDESARTLLERITAEMNARNSSENKYRRVNGYLQNARVRSKAKDYYAALQAYELVLQLDPLHAEARQEYNQLRQLLDSSQVDEKISALVREGQSLLEQNQLNPAAEKINQALALRPDNAMARDLLNRIESERIRLNRIATQLEVARYLYERNEKESAALVLNNILLTHPDQPQAKQLLSRIRGTSSVPKVPLEIRIQPPAQLWIDGRDLGTNSYFRYTESIGPHIIHIESRGYHSLDQSIELKSTGKNVFQFELKQQ